MTLKTAEPFIRPSTVVGGAAIGGLLGLGARGLRHVFDITRNRDESGGVDIPAQTPAAVKMPVEVSPEEAAELEAKGVHVKHKLAGFVNQLATGVAGTLAGYGGWRLADKHFDELRKRKAQQALDATRNRVQALLSNQPMAGDEALHATMKAAEDTLLKEAGFADMLSRLGVGAADSGIGALGIGIPVGIGGTLLGLSAFNEAKKNKYEQKEKALKGYFERQQTQPPQAELEPVLTQHGGIPKAASIKDLGERLKGKLHGGSAR